MNIDRTTQLIKYVPLGGRENRSPALRNGKVLTSRSNSKFNLKKKPKVYLGTLKFSRKREVIQNQRSTWAWKLSQVTIKILIHLDLNTIDPNSLYQMIWKMDKKIQLLIVENQFSTDRVKKLQLTIDRNERDYNATVKK